MKEEPRIYISASIWEKANRKERKTNVPGDWSDDGARSEASDWPIPIGGRKREDEPLETLFALLSFLLSWNRSERCDRKPPCHSRLFLLKRYKKAAEIDDNWSFLSWLCESRAPNVTNPDAWRGR